MADVTDEIRWVSRFTAGGMFIYREWVVSVWYGRDFPGWNFFLNHFEACPDPEGAPLFTSLISLDAAVAKARQSIDRLWEEAFIPDAEEHPCPTPSR